MATPYPSLFDDAPYQHDGADGLPLITDRASDRILVYTPGHLYAPSPVEVDRIGRAAGPGALIATERKFIANLIRHLDPDHARNEDVIKRIPAAIQQGQREYFLLRNLDRSPEGTRLRLADENWFYPDFIFWILDKATQPETQRLCYLDPKGLEMGARGGWNHSKVLCFSYKLVEIASQFQNTCNRNGQPVRFILKGAFVSTTQRQELERTTAGSQEFHVYDDAGRKVFPGYDDFAKGGIFFAERTDHIEQLMTYLLAGESLLDQVMRCAATAANLPEDTLPDDEIGCFFRYLLRNANSLSAALGELVRYTLTASDLNHVIARLQRESRKELLPYLKKGVLQKMTGGMEDVERIPRPCRELLQRFQPQSAM
ncbi:MAG: hypothetical protein MUC53_10355 [Candidatus Contendobacter sp.]|nr:hypothetical protein [Candidatus Contendobacter sp.]